MALENQSTTDSGVIVDGINSSGNFRVASGVPHVPSPDKRPATSSRDAGSEDVLPPSYVKALLSLNIDVVTTIRDCLKREDPQRQFRGVRALREASRDFPDARAAIGAAGAARALLKVLRERDPALLVEALQALINLTCECPENRVLIPTASMEALSIIIDQLDSDSEEVQEKAAELVFSLSLDNSNKVELNHSGVTAPLIRLLSQPTDACRVACKALFNISLAASCRYSVIQAGAVTPLMRLASDSYTQAGRRVSEKALLVLKVLATVPDGWDEISAVPGWAQTLVQILEDGTPVGQEAAVAVLLDLGSRSKERKHIILEADPLPIVFKLTQSRDKRLRQRALDLQRMLTAER